MTTEQQQAVALAAAFYLLVDAPRQSKVIADAEAWRGHIKEQNGGKEELARRGDSSAVAALIDVLINAA